MLLFFVVTRLMLNVEKPGTAQNLAEVVHEFVSNQADSIIGHGYRTFCAVRDDDRDLRSDLQLHGSAAGRETPTANPVVPLGIAIPTFFYYNWQGLRANGVVGYAKTFPRADLVDLVAAWSH